jgi:hypothetical protein
MTFRRLFTFLGIVSALALVPTAQAANLFIDDSVEGQIKLTHDPNWEFGVISNGLAFPGRVTGSTTAQGESATFSGSWTVNSPGNPDPGTGIIYFVDQAAKQNSCRRGHHHHHHHHHHHRGHRGDRGDRHSHGHSRHQAILPSRKLGLADVQVRRDANVRGGGRHRKSVCVSDIVRANWSTTGRQANISFTISSSACDESLGRLPRNFAGLGVPDPVSPIETVGLFRNPTTGAPVAIPSNLTVQFVGDADTPCRGDDDDDDDQDDD